MERTTLSISTDRCRRRATTTRLVILCDRERAAPVVLEGLLWSDEMGSVCRAA